jgi:hypothetical protein
MAFQRLRHSENVEKSTSFDAGTDAGRCGRVAVPRGEEARIMRSESNGDEGRPPLARR